MITPITKAIAAFWQELQALRDQQEELQMIMGITTEMMKIALHHSMVASTSNTSQNVEAMKRKLNQGVSIVKSHFDIVVLFSFQPHRNASQPSTVHESCGPHAADRKGQCPITTLREEGWMVY